MGLQTEGLYRGQLDTQELWVRVTVEFFPCINELSSDLYHFLKKAKISIENLRNKMSVLFIMLTCRCNYMIILKPHYYTVQLFGGYPSGLQVFVGTSWNYSN